MEELLRRLGESIVGRESCGVRGYLERGGYEGK